MSIEDLSEGVFGIIHFDVDGQTITVPGAKLSFDPVKGAKLEWSPTNQLPSKLEKVRGAFSIGTVEFEHLRRVKYTTGFGGDRVVYACGAIVSSGYHVSPSTTPVSVAKVPIPLLHTYVNGHILESTGGGTEWTGYRVRTVEINLGEISSLKATGDLVVYAEGVSRFAEGATIRPSPWLVLKFHQAADFAQLMTSVRSASTFMEFIMDMPAQEPFVRFIDHQRRDVTYRSKLGYNPIKKESLSVWQMPFQLCEEVFGLMLNGWCARFANSREVDQFLRLSRYPDLPVELQFFMAFTGLGLLNCSIGNFNPRKKFSEGEVKHLRLTKDAWRILLPDKDDEQLERYFLRLANTRHDIAHLSKEDHEVLSTPRDVNRGMRQLLCIARARLLEEIGLPHQQAVLFLQAMRQRIKDQLGDVPTSLFS